jgi:hypothetical protein
MSEIFEQVTRRIPDLLLPKIVSDLKAEQLADICNGCGPASMKFKLIPDVLLGVSFRTACNGHDAMYHFGVDESDKEESDILFLGNMLRAVNRHYPGDGLEDRLLRKAARHAAYLYFEAVADWGKSAFYAGKEK